MTPTLTENAFDSAMIALAVPFVHKVRTAAAMAKKEHGSYFKVDGEILKSALSKNARTAVIGGVLVGAVFFTARQISSVVEDKMDPPGFQERVTASRAPGVIRSRS